jgi:predicted Zn-dependent peptidase
MSSRLFQRIREKEGLVYSVLSNTTDCTADTKRFTRPARRGTPRVLAMTLEEMKKIMPRALTRKNCRPRNCISRDHPLLESTVSRMSGIARQEYY